MLLNNLVYILKYFIGIVLVIFLLGLNACTVKKVSKEAYQPVTLDEDYLTRNAENYNSINRVWFKKFSASFEINGKEQKFKGNIRLVKDSLIILGLSSNMGIEAFRVMLRKDSIFVLNRLKSTYYAGNVSELGRGRLRIMNFQVIQDILLANSQGLFLLDVKPETLKTNQGKSLCYLNSEAEYHAFIAHNKLIAKKTCYSKTDGLLEAGDLIFSEWNETISVVYPEYSMISGSLIPASLVLVSSYREKIERLELTFEKTEINKSFPTSIKIGSKYKRVKSLNAL